MHSFLWWKTNGTETEAQRFAQLMCKQFLYHKQWHVTLLQGAQTAERWITCWKLKTVCMQHVVQHIQWRRPESVQCHDFIAMDFVSGPGWHFTVCYIAIIWTIHTHYSSLQITFCDKLNVRDCIRWHWNRNDCVWICVVCLWKVQFIGFQSEVCKNTIFHGVCKLIEVRLWTALIWHVVFYVKEYSAYVLLVL
jgi:hypothetical protein